MSEAFINGIEGGLTIADDTATFTATEPAISVTVKPATADQGTILCAIGALLSTLGLPVHS